MEGLQEVVGGVVGPVARFRMYRDSSIVQSWYQPAPVRSLVAVGSECGVWRAPQGNEGVVRSAHESEGRNKLNWMGGDVGEMVVGLTSEGAGRNTFPS